MNPRSIQFCTSFLTATVWLTLAGTPARSQESSPSRAVDEPASSTDQAAAPLEPLPLRLPKPAFKGTPKHIPPNSNLEKPRKGRRPPLLAPKGTANIAAAKKVTCSDDDPIIGEAELITDGDKEASEGSYVEFGPGVQYVQIDLDRDFAIHAVVVWHYHGSARVYHDVIVQVSEDKDFIAGVTTLYNNDHDNSSGLGVGRDKEYWDTYEGRLIDAKGVVGRYVRLYSNGSTSDDQNHYTEVEVFGLPVK